MSYLILSESRLTCWWIFRVLLPMVGRTWPPDQPAEGLRWLDLESQALLLTARLLSETSSGSGRGGLFTLKLWNPNNISTLINLALTTMTIFFKKNPSPLLSLYYMSGTDPSTAAHTDPTVPGGTGWEARCAGLESPLPTPAVMDLRVAL